MTDDVTTRLVDSMSQLQQALDQLAAAEDTLENLPPEMRELHQRHSEGKAAIDDVRQRIEAATLANRQAEAESSDWQVKLDHFQQQISAVKTQREYGAILSEIDQANEHKDAAESTALAALEEIEAAETELDELEQAFADLDGEYKAAEAQWQQDRPGVESRRDQLVGEVAELREQLPPPVLTRFQRILDHTDGHAMSPVVPINRGTGASLWACSNCSYRVRPQVVVEIRTHGKIAQCEGCKRFLYVDESSLAQEAS